MSYYHIGDRVVKISKAVDSGIPIGTEGVIINISLNYIYVSWDNDYAQEYASIGRSYMLNSPADYDSCFYHENAFQPAGVILKSDWESEIEFSEIAS